MRLNQSFRGIRREHRSDDRPELRPPILRHIPRRSTVKHLSRPECDFYSGQFARTAANLWDLVILRLNDPIAGIPFAVLTPHDSSAFERSNFNKDVAALGKSIGAHFGRDFVPAKFSVIPADLFTYGFLGDLAHRQSLAVLGRSNGKTLTAVVELPEFGAR
jgi:hypothetical protein